MTGDRPLYLHEFQPKPELIVEEHHVPQPKFPVVDFMAHFGKLCLGENYEDKYETADFVNALKSNGIEHVVNLAGFWGTELERVLRKIHPYEEFVSTCGTVDTSRIDEPGFESYVRSTIKDSLAKGIEGLAFWKNLGLEVRDSQGNLVRVDDPRLDVIWQTAAEYKLPVILQVGDPKAFFKPADRFNERYEELAGKPGLSFAGPEYPGFEELMAMQEAVIARNPATVFVVPHGGGYAENLAQVAQWLDAYPNLYIDITAKLAEFGRQPYTSRRFFNRYQDRIVLGADVTPFNMKYHIYYRFLETYDEYFNYSTKPIPHQGRWMIYGIGLDNDVLEKVYNKNAWKILRRGTSEYAD